MLRLFRKSIFRQIALPGIALLVASSFGAETDVVRLEQFFTTATKLPITVENSPGMVSVVSGRELADRGVHDLRGALALVGGVDIAPGGDAGPAGSAPGLWGLREADAFLLVVDGVPYGGAFNPALASLDLTNVARIEVLRGAAPVMYGATSFVGVIHVIHAAPGESPATFSASGGSQDSGAAAWSANLPDWGKLKQSLTLNAERRRFSQDDASLERYHALYRAAGELSGGQAHLDLELTSLKQSPYSPHPREGATLTGRFPLDANINPRDARADLDHAQLNAGFDRDTGSARWITTASLARSEAHNTRGFLRDNFATDGVTPNADGFRQKITTTDFYLNSYLAWTTSPQLQTALGFDLLYGHGTQRSNNFEYAVFPDGRNRPDSHTRPTDEITTLADTRRFYGLYTEVQWTPDTRWHFVAGLRLNRTRENRDATLVQSGIPGVTADSDQLTKERLSGSIGFTYRVWEQSKDSATLFADYRNTYKPAAIDFGPEAEGEILRPETAQSWQTGFRGQALDGHLDWEASYFEMRFENLLIRENVGGLPALANAGRERFKGAEFEGGYAFSPDLRLSASYAWHDARFSDYARRRPDNSIQQLAGKRLELSPQLLSAFGLTYSPKLGLFASATWNHVGSRYLNKGNTSVASSYDLLDAGLGYRWKTWSLRLDGANLLDRRDPATESELGDAQFYRLPGRAILLSVSRNL